MDFADFADFMYSKTINILHNILVQAARLWLLLWLSNFVFHIQDFITENPPQPHHQIVKEVMF